MTDDNNDTPTTPTLECGDCHRTFKNQSALMMHSRTHRTETDVAATGGAAPAPLWDTVIPPTGAGPQMPTGHVYSGSTSVTSHSNSIVLKIKKLPHFGNLPDLKRGSPDSVGFDLYAAISQEVTIGINHWELIPTGIAVELPSGYCAKIAPRSGLAAHHGITVLNTPGIIDPDYKDEIMINLVNNTTSKFRVQPGMRIAQMLIEKVEPVTIEYVDQLSGANRGGGFGSTGMF